jgi:hypothetical protein
MGVSQLSTPKTSSANLGFGQKLWLAADKLRNNRDAAELDRIGDNQPQTARATKETRLGRRVNLNPVVKRLEFLTFPPYIKSHESDSYF